MTEPATEEIQELFKEEQNRTDMKPASGFLLSQLTFNGILTEDEIQ